MLRNNTKKFLEWAETCMPNLVGRNQPDIEEFDDCVTLQYELCRPMNKEDVMNCLEDDMELTILYCAKSNESESKSYISAITTPTGIYLFKFNAVSDSNDIVTTLTAIIYDSITDLTDIVLTDLNAMEKRNMTFETKVEDGVLSALFCE